MFSHALKHQTAVVSRSWEGEVNLLDEMKNIYSKKPIMIQKNSGSDQPSVKRSARFKVFVVNRH
jgi:hypothetical protein